MKYPARIAMLLVGSSIVLGSQEASAKIVSVASVPITYTPSGRVEIWSKLIGYSATDRIATNAGGGSDFPYILFSNGIQLGFTRNNGVGGGGLAGSAPGGVAATGSFGQPFTYGDILGNQASVNAWHKYDLVWNINGLADGNHIDLYVDDKLTGSPQYHVNQGPPFPSGPGTLFFGRAPDLTNDPRDIAFDELRIWNTSDPMPGSLVLANSFENKNLISSVGANGTYLSGRFVNGVVGNALQTGVPEPATWALMLAGFGGVGAILRARRRAEFAA